MKNWKTYVSLLLALVLCLSLTACGNGKAEVSSDSKAEVSSDSKADAGSEGAAEISSNPIPNSIKELVVDDSVEHDYTIFLGTWLDQEGNVLTMEEYDDGRVHFQLSDTNEALIAGGTLLYMEKYQRVYAYNEYDGIAYLCQFNEDDLRIESLGTFTKVSGDVPGETIGDTEEELGQPADAGDSGNDIEPYYWYDENGDIWYWNGYEDVFICDGSDGYIEDGQFFESNDAGWDYDDEYYDDYDPWSDPGDDYDPWSDPGDDYDDGWGDYEDDWDYYDDGWGDYFD